MTRKGIIQRNIKRVKLFNKFKVLRNSIKKKIYNKNCSVTKRFQMQKLFDKIPRNSSKVRIRNRCIVTGRGKGIYRLFMLSRICIREMAANGQLPGVIKSSWLPVFGPGLIYVGRSTGPVF